MAKTTKMIVRELKVISSKPEYTLHQVRAVKPDGSPIVDAQGQELNLRSFQELPRNRVIDVEVERYDSEKYGTSFTIKAVNYSLTDRVEELEARIKALEDKLANLQAPAPTAPPDPPTDTVPQIPATVGVEPEDIPF
jgi:hypothetical protein